MKKRDVEQLISGNLDLTLPQNQRLFDQLAIEIFDNAPLFGSTSFDSHADIYRLSINLIKIDVEIIGNEKKYQNPVLGIQAGLDGLDLEVSGADGPDAVRASIGLRRSSDLSKRQFDLLRMQLNHKNGLLVSVSDLDSARLHVVQTLAKERENGRD